MAVIISQVARQGQHLLFLFFPLDTKGNLDPPDGQEVKTANPLRLDQLGHADILQDVVDARKRGNAFSFLLTLVSRSTNMGRFAPWIGRTISFFYLLLFFRCDIIAAAAFAAACNCRANDTT
jgi:hypothetical protein